MKHCCEDMSRELERSCDIHDDRWDCPDAVIDYCPKFNEYGLIIHDGGRASYSISFCPWCGYRLPESMRDKWFEELEALGIDDPLDDTIPEVYQDARWYSARNVGKDKN